MKKVTAIITFVLILSLSTATVFAHGHGDTAATEAITRAEIVREAIMWMPTVTESVTTGELLYAGQVPAVGTETEAGI